MKQNSILPSLLGELGGIYFTAVAPHKTSCAGEDLAKGILDFSANCPSAWT